MATALRGFEPASLRDINAAAFNYYTRLQRIEHHVATNISRPITLAEAAGVARLERKYFSAFFRAKVGVSFSDWLSGVRVARAIELLRRHNYTILHVAGQVGFENLRTFERAFKRETGFTPNEFKSRVRPA